MKEKKKTSKKPVEDVVKEEPAKIEPAIQEQQFEVKKDDTGVPFNERIENARNDLLVKYKKNKQLSTIVTFVVVVLVIAAFILMYQESEGFKITGYVVAGATLLGMIAFYIINRNRFPDATRDYINFISAQFNGFVFEDSAYEKLTMDPKDKLDQGEIAADRVYTGIARLGSRNIVQGIYLHEHFTIADVAAYTRGDKKQEVAAFVGKYTSFPNNRKIEGRIIITIKGEKEIDLPTDISDLVKVEEAEKMTILATEGLNIREILGEPFMKAIEKFKVSENLMNLNIAIWGGHTALYMSYNDEMMVLPFEKAFNEEPIKQYKDEQIKLLKIVSLLNK